MTKENNEPVNDISILFLCVWQPSIGTSTPYAWILWHGFANCNRVVWCAGEVLKGGGPWHVGTHFQKARACLEAFRKIDHHLKTKDDLRTNITLTFPSVNTSLDLALEFSGALFIRLVDVPTVPRMVSGIKTGLARAPTFQISLITSLTTSPIFVLGTSCFNNKKKN
jgi:hypothetical protein